MTLSTYLEGDDDKAPITKVSRLIQERMTVVYGTKKDVGMMTGLCDGLMCLDRVRGAGPTPLQRMEALLDEEVDIIMGGKDDEFYSGRAYGLGLVITAVSCVPLEEVREKAMKRWRKLGKPDRRAP